MNNTTLIFGAGKTGRGFAAHLAFLGGYDIILIDKNRQLVASLKNAGQYEIQVLNNEKRNCIIDLSNVYYIGDERWHEDFVATSLVFTSVFGNNLEQLAKYLAKALQKRYMENPGQDLTIITCENLTGAGSFIKKMVLKTLGEEKENWLSKYVGFSEAIIFRTCLEATDLQSPLTVRAQNFFELPCDADAIKGDLHVFGLKPMKNFSQQLRRKIFTYNCINAVITYLGAEKGYSQLYEAGNDAKILETARKAANETSLAQIAEFGFNDKEQEEWVSAAFEKFADKNIPDPIERNGVDPIRKLGRDDRLIGPALLAVKHHIYPEGLLEGVMACFKYHSPNKSFRIADLIPEQGPDIVLKEICGLTMDDELFMLIKDKIVKTKWDAGK